MRAALERPRGRRADDGYAFLPDLVRHHGGPIDADADAEEFLVTATSAEHAFEAARDELAVEELGGPFVDDEESTFARSAGRASAEHQSPPRSVTRMRVRRRRSHRGALERAAMRINGNVVTEGLARAGDVTEIHNAAVFVVHAGR